MNTEIENNSEEKNPRKSDALSLRRDTRGMSSVEYLILLVVIAVAGITVWSKVGKTITKKAGAAETSLDKMK